MAFNVIAGDPDLLDAFLVRIRMEGDTNTIFFRGRLRGTYDHALAYRNNRLLFSNKTYVRWHTMQNMAFEMGLRSHSEISTDNFIFGEP